MSDWSQALPEALSPDLVVNDGEMDVSGAVAETYPEAGFQRCEWHLVYGLDKALWNDGVEYKIQRWLQRELHEQVFGPGEGRDRRSDIRAWAADRLGTHERARSLVASAVGEVCYEPPSSLRTTSHAEREMRELNRRTDVGARWTIRGVRNLLRLRLARFYNPGDYDRVWDSQSIELRLEARVSLASVSTT